MSKFILVKEFPKDLRRDEYIVRFPDFKEEIEPYYLRINNRFKITQVNMLRNIFATIAAKYDPSIDYNSKIPYSLHEGLQIDTLEKLVSIVNEMIRKYAPNAYRKHMETQLKNRPVGIKICYFDGPFSYSDVFDKLGIQMAEEKDRDFELGIVEKKATGRPVPANKVESNKTNNKKKESEDKTEPGKAN